MRAEILGDGTLVLSAQSQLESFALRHWANGFNPGETGGHDIRICILPPEQEQIGELVTPDDMDPT